VCHRRIFLSLLSFQIQIFSCSQTPSVCVLTLRLADQVVNPHLTALYFHDFKNTAAIRNFVFCYLPLGTVWCPTSLDSSKVQFFRWSREYMLRKYAAVRCGVVKGGVFNLSLKTVPSVFGSRFLICTKTYLTCVHKLLLKV